MIVNSVVGMHRNQSNYTWHLGQIGSDTSLTSGFKKKKKLHIT